MKLRALTDILPFVKPAKLKGQTIVLVTGVFDLLHQEHVNFLKKAKAAGNILVVGLETDARVREIKGEKIPINRQAVRLKNLENLHLADYVFLLPQAFNRQGHWENFIATLRPDIYAVSSHTNYLANKRKIMTKFGGVVKIVHQFNPAVSTTQLLNRKLDNES